ncbi:MAG: ABC transporter substrate-binding protein, partial [Comamonas sp.]
MIQRRSLLASGALASLSAWAPFPSFAQSKKDTVTLALTLEPPVLDPTASAS